MMKRGSFLLSTLSMGLAVGGGLYSQFHHFPSHAPSLMAIYAAGTLLALGALACSVVSLVRRRDRGGVVALLAALAVLAFWLVMIGGE